MVYILGGIVGLVLSKIGSGIMSAAARRASISGHMVAATITVVVAIAGLVSSARERRHRRWYRASAELFHTGTDPVPAVAPLTSNGGGTPQVVKPQQLPPVVPTAERCDSSAEQHVCASRYHIVTDSGPVGTTLSVTGRCFEPGEVVVIRFHTDTIAEPTADERAASSANGTVPNSYRPFAGTRFDVSATGKVSIRSDSQPFELTAG